MSLSPDLKRLVIVDVGESADRALDKFEAALRDGSFTRYRIGDAAEKHYQELLERVVEVRDGLASLEHDAPELSDDTFSRRFDELRAAIEVIEERARKPWDLDLPSTFATGFARPDEIATLKDFAEKAPMFWVPTVEETTRIFGAALCAHRARVERGEKGEGDPVTIVDVGGANAFFASLLVEVGRRNGIPVQVTVVDPDPSIRDAVRAYSTVPELRFVQSTAAQFALDAHADSPETLPLLQAREAILETGTSQVRMLRVALREFVRDTPLDDQLSGGRAPIFDRMLREDFAIPLATDKSPAAMIEALVRHYEDHLTTINRELAAIEVKPIYDLVLNAYMPPRMNFCRDIESSRGAAVAYVLETEGASGIQCFSLPLNERTKIGLENSYVVRPDYDPVARWTGPSIYHVSKRVENRGGLNNTSEVQIRFSATLSSDFRTLSPATLGLDPGPPYAWEPALVAAFGARNFSREGPQKA